MAPSRVVLMCGIAGSGKSAHAKALERQGFTRLSIDEEAWSRGFTRHPLPDDVARAVEDDLEKRLRELVRAGRNVVVDYSFWSRAARDRYRGIVEECGGVCELVYLRVPGDVLRERLARRNRKTGPNAIQVDEQTLRSYIDGFEEPSDDEHPTTLDQALGP